MLFVKEFAIFFICVCVYACQKPKDEPNIQPNNPINVDSSNTTNVDSNNVSTEYLLSSINGDYAYGQSFEFEYDNDNNLIKFYRPSSWGLTSPCYVIYRDGIVNNIISEYKDINSQILKASMIFLYGSNGKCDKICYKKQTDQNLNNTSPYFTDLTDGNLHYEYDSLAYSSTDQILEIYKMDNSKMIPKTISIIKFYYKDSSDTSLNKLEEYRFDDNGDSYLYDQLLLTTNTIANPVRRSLWYFPFVFNLTNITGGGGNVMFLPILYDGPSTYLNLYTPLVSNCITSYKVYNNWGYHNYTKTVYKYSYSADSLLLRTVKQDDPFSYVNYVFKRTKQ